MSCEIHKNKEILLRNNAPQLQRPNGLVVGTVNEFDGRRSNCHLAGTHGKNDLTLPSVHYVQGIDWFEVNSSGLRTTGKSFFYVPVTGSFGQFLSRCCQVFSVPDAQLLGLFPVGDCPTVRLPMRKRSRPRTEYLFKLSQKSTNLLKLKGGEQTHGILVAVWITG